MYEYYRRPNPSTNDFYKYISCGSLTRDAAPLAAGSPMLPRATCTFQPLTRDAAPLACIFKTRHWSGSTVSTPHAGCGPFSLTEAEQFSLADIRFNPSRGMRPL